MKNCIIILFFCTLLLSLSAQDKKKLVIPEIVKQHMAVYCPQISSPDAYVKWDKEGVNFKLTTKGYKDSFKYIVMDSLGNFVRLEEQVSLNALPKKSLDYLYSKYPGAEIKEAYQMRDNTQPNFFYRIKAVVKTDMRFDTEGNLLEEKFK
jgi:hypothetical protein